MKIGVTGGTGFIGRYILNKLAKSGHSLRCWKRPESNVRGLDHESFEWINGSLTDEESMRELASGCDAIVHGALWKPGKSFRGGEGDVARFAEVNLIGSLKLIQQAMDQGVRRFVFISTCAVHEIIMDDRKLDEAHPLWATSHYGAHKAAIEKFVHSYGLGQGYDICALRPTGVYGRAEPVSSSKWYALVESVVRGEEVSVSGGGKEVHAADVAQAVELLLNAEGIAGQAYNCYGGYIAQHDVACIAREISGSDSKIVGEPTSPKHQIVTDKLRELGMEFGGRDLLEATIAEMVHEIRSANSQTV